MNWIQIWLNMNSIEEKNRQIGAKVLKKWFQGWMMEVMNIHDFGVEKKITSKTCKFKKTHVHVLR
jgi:hypothetical protein